MSVAVVIVNWNSGPLLAKCLRHVAAQTLQPDSVFVVDNASTDGSADALPEIAGLQLLRMPDNLGFAKGNNVAIELCTAEHVVFLNPDAFAAPDWLAALTAAATRYPEAGAFGSRQMTDANPDVIDDIGDCYHFAGIAWQGGHGARLCPEYLEPSEIFAPCAAAALYRRSVLAEVGGFDEAYFCYMEDLDLAFRTRLAGYAVRYVPDAVVRHVGSATSGGRLGVFAVYHGHRNAVWTFVKNMPGLLFWLALPFHLLVNLAMVLRFVRLGMGRTILRAKLDAVRGLPAAWRKRSRIQAMRKASLADIWRVLRVGLRGYRS